MKYFHTIYSKISIKLKKLLESKLLSDDYESYLVECAKTSLKLILN